jgi:hypothetical protein
VGEPGREFGKLAGTIESKAGGPIMAGDGVFYERASKWTARRPAVRPGKEPVLHRFEAREYPRVITGSAAPALKIFSGDSVRTRTIGLPPSPSREVAMIVTVGIDLTSGYVQSMRAGRGFDGWKPISGWNPSEVAAVLGTAMEYQIADLVGMQMGVAARIRKSVLAKMGTGTR